MAIDKQLAKFMEEFANGGAIRHLADSGMTVSEIIKHLDFPMSQEKVAQIVWNYYLETGKICLSYPKDSEKIEKVTYVEEYDKYGKPSLRRVSEHVDRPGVEYVPCDFGKMRYQDLKAFEKKLEFLPEREKNYIESLPWPLQTVYHQKDEMMVNIMKHLEKKSVE